MVKGLTHRGRVYPRTQAPPHGEEPGYEARRVLNEHKVVTFSIQLYMHVHIHVNGKTILQLPTNSKADKSTENITAMHC